MFPVLQKKAEVVGGLAWLPYSKEDEQAMTVSPKFGEAVCLAVKHGKHLGVPRNCVTDYEIDDRVAAKLEVGAINCTVPPRNDEQKRVIKESLTLLLNDKSHIIKATTGFGKTYCALAIAAKLNRRTLIVVTKEDMMMQWYKWICLGDPEKKLPPYLDVKPEEVGFVQQDVCDYHGKKFVIAMVHSLAKDKYPEELKAAFGLVIFDEVHRMAADTFSLSCGMFPAQLRLGLSATVKRVDEKDFVFRAHIGPIAVETQLVGMPPKILFQQTKFQIPIKPQRVYDAESHTWQWMTMPLVHSPGKMMRVIKAMAADVKRNDLIVRFVYAAWKKGRRVIVFSDLKDDHLVPLYWQLIKLIPAGDMTYYVGGMSETEREVAKTKKILLATYKMTAEATDIPELDTAVLATPRANVLQPVGRILREVEGKKEPVVYDLVDECSPVLTAFRNKRRADYYTLNAKMLVLT